MIKIAVIKDQFCERGLLTVSGYEWVFMYDGGVVKIHPDYLKDLIGQLSTVLYDQFGAITIAGNLKDDYLTPIRVYIN